MNQTWIRNFAINSIEELVGNSPKNTLYGIDEKSWASPPVVGFASGSDPLFKSYKELIGEFYWTPAEAMQIAYPDKIFDEDSLSVICWLLPQTEETKQDQRKEKNLPAKRWVYSRHYGEKFNEYLRGKLRDMFINLGIEAVAPVILDDFGYQHSKQAGICSNWSERHTAYAAGMGGTFGLSDGFITEKGKAIRIGSLIINYKLQPDIRRYQTHTENCLYYAKGKCGACIKRCPADAITSKGHDKQLCFEYIRGGVTAPHAYDILGENQTPPCGLCQAKVPCESRNPVKVI